jgi:hypothetical protein
MAKQDNVIRGESWTSRPRTEDPKGEATMPSSVDQSENAVREAPASAAQTLPEDAALKCRSCRKGQIRPARAHDPADRDAGDHALRLGSPG